MKATYVFALILMSALWSSCSRTSVKADKENDTTSAYVEVDSITFTEQRAALGDQLEQLRDSVENALSRVQSNPAKDTILQNKRLRDLELTLDRIQRDLDEVNMSSLKSWDADYVERIRLNVIENRRALMQAHPTDAAESNR